MLERVKFLWHNLHLALVLSSSSGSNHSLYSSIAIQSLWNLVVILASLSTGLNHTENRYWSSKGKQNRFWFPLEQKAMTAVHRKLPLPHKWLWRQGVPNPFSVTYCPYETDLLWSCHSPRHLNCKEVSAKCIIVLVKIDQKLLIPLPKKGKCETPKMLFLRKFAHRLPWDFALLGIVGPSLNQIPH